MKNWQKLTFCPKFAPLSQTFVFVSQNIRFPNIRFPKIDFRGASPKNGDIIFFENYFVELRKFMHDYNKWILKVIIILLNLPGKLFAVVIE